MRKNGTSIQAAKELPGKLRRGFPGQRQIGRVSLIAFGLFLCDTTAFAVTSCASVSGNLVTNCSFETGDFTGWTRHNPINNDFISTGYGVADGTYAADFGDYPNNPGYISQTLTTTTGAIYAISLYITERSGGGNLVKVQFGGTTLATISNFTYTTPTLVTYTATATSSSTVLTLSGADLPDYVFIDNVVVVQVPALSVSATHSTPIYQGGPGSITLTVANIGGATAANATVTDTIDPTAFSINSFPTGCSVSGADQIVTCTVAAGSTAASTPFTIYVTALTSASTSAFTNTATLADSVDTISTSPANDTITIGAELSRVDSSLSQLMLSGVTDNGACAAGNQTFTATDTLENTSRSTINNPYAEIATLSNGNTLLSQSASVSSVAQGANVTFTFHIQLANCKTFQLFFDVQGN